MEPKISVGINGLKTCSAMRLPQGMDLVPRRVLPKAEISNMIWKWISLRRSMDSKPTSR
jgi:hypothetical protein